MTRQIECRVASFEGAKHGFTTCANCISWFRPSLRHGMKPACAHPSVERSPETNVGRYITDDPYRRIPDFCPLPKGTIIVEEDAS